MLKPMGKEVGDSICLVPSLALYNANLLIVFASLLSLFLSLFLYLLLHLHFLSLQNTLKGSMLI